MYYKQVEDDLKVTTLLFRYVVQGSRWQVKELTYKVSKYSSSDRLGFVRVGLTNPQGGGALKQGPWAQAPPLVCP